MDGLEVVIRQSVLFNFEWGGNAPFDYFTRILASRCLEEDNKSGIKKEEDGELC